MPFDPAWIPERAVNCALDEMLPVLPRELSQDPRCRSLTVAERVDEILASIEERYGSFCSDERSSAAWRKAFVREFTQALIGIPVTLVNPHPDFRYAVIWGRQIVLMAHDGRLVHSRDWMNMSPSSSVQSEFLALAANPDSVFHYNRPALGSPAHDPIFNDCFGFLFNGVLNKSVTIDFPLKQFMQIPRRRHNRFSNMIFGMTVEIEEEPVTEPARNLPEQAKDFLRSSLKKVTTAIVATVRGTDPVAVPDDFFDQEPDADDVTEVEEFRQPLAFSRAQYAAGSLLSKLHRVSAVSFGMCVRRMVDPVIYRDALRTGIKNSYWWLAAVGKHEDQATISLRRRQFARAYPELVSYIVCLQNDARIRRELVAPDHAFDLYDQAVRSQILKIERSVDAAVRIGPLVSQLRGWPGWVEKTLKGRLSATRARGMYMPLGVSSLHPSGQDVAALLTGLGPAWRPRGGDDVIMAVFASLTSSLNLPPRSVALLCQHPGKGASPWKQAWRQLPEEFRNRFKRSKKRWEDDEMIATFLRETHRDLCDMIRAFRGDVVEPLLGHRVDLGPAQDFPQTAPRRSPFHSLSLAGLFEKSREWHERFEVIRRAKTGAVPPSDEPNQWDPLFAPFSVVETRVEVACLTTPEQLAEHGSDMNHCVASYAQDCLQGRCHIVGFSREGTPLATAELGNAAGALRQMRGQNNKVPPKETLDALQLLRTELNLANADAVAGLETVLDTVYFEDVSEDSGLKTGDQKLGLYTTPIEQLEASKQARVEAFARRRIVQIANYDFNNPESVERILVAWRFAMPDRMRAAWERGQGPAERVENVRAWLRTWYATTCSQEAKAA